MADRKRITLNENQQWLVLEGLRMIYRERVNRARENNCQPSELRDVLDELITIGDKLDGLDQ